MFIFFYERRQQIEKVLFLMCLFKYADFLLGLSQSIGLASGVLASLFANPIIGFFGRKNTITFATLLNCLRLVLYGAIT